MRKPSVHLIGHVAYIILYGLQIVLSIFFYQSGSIDVLIYAGWCILILGIFLVSWSIISRKRGMGFVSNGIYACVRHPEFLGHMLIILSLALLAQHLLSLIVGGVLIFLLYLAMVEEEKKNLEKFGDSYREYMRGVPRVNLILGVLRICVKRRR